MLNRQFYASASVLILCSISLSNPLYAAAPVAVSNSYARNGGGAWAAIMSNGDVYNTAQVPASGCTLGTLTWSFAHNIYALAGHGSGVIVGAVAGWAVDANGDLYQPGYPTFYGNVFTLANRPPSRVALFSDMANSYGNIVTVDGDLYEFNALGCGEVSWLGSVPSTPTAARPTSWGQLKVRYR